MSNSTCVNKCPYPFPYRLHPLSCLGRYFVRVCSLFPCSSRENQSWMSGWNIFKIQDCSRPRGCEAATSSSLREGKEILSKRIFIGCFEAIRGQKETRQRATDQGKLFSFFSRNELKCGKPNLMESLFKVFVVYCLCFCLSVLSLPSFL